MATLATSGLVLPQNIADGMWDKAQTGSVISRVAQATPLKFGQTTFMTFTTNPKAEYVGEGAQKASTEIGYGTKTVKPYKVQVTMRFNQEVKWADEDYQLGVLTDMADKGAVALSRALDLGIIHGINPLTGTAVASITDELFSTVTNSTEIGTATAAQGGVEGDIENAVGLLVAAGYNPTGIAFDPKLAWTLATQRFTDGRKVHPDMDLTANLGSFLGLSAATGNTVSGLPEIADSKLRAIVADWSALKWGVQRQVPVSLIEYGDPTGDGDLQRLNQIALRLEIVYGWGVMDVGAFSLLKDAT